MADDKSSYPQAYWRILQRETLDKVPAAIYDIAIYRDISPDGLYLEVGKCGVSFLSVSFIRLSWREEL